MSVAKLMKKVLDETVRYYSEDYRYALFGDQCYYRTVDGSGQESFCAAGRMMKKSVLKKMGNFLGDVGEFLSEYRKEYYLDATLEDVLYKKYRGLPRAFIEKLQNLHDEAAQFSDNDVYKMDELIEHNYFVENRYNNCLKFIKEYEGVD